MEKQTEKWEVTKELKHFWKEIESRTTIKIEDMNKLNTLFENLWLKLDRRIERLEKSRDNWKEKATKKENWECMKK